MIDETNECNRHVEDPRHFGGDPVEGFFRERVEDLQAFSSLSRSSSFAGMGAGIISSVIVTEHFASCTTASARETTTSSAPEERSRSDISSLFSVAPQIPTMIFARGKAARIFPAEEARVNQGRRRDHGNADRFRFRLGREFNHFTAG